MQMNRPSPRLAILRAQLAAEQFGALCQRAEYIISAEQPRCRPAPPPDADSLPLPPSYWDDMEEMWPASAETLTPAKPAAQQPAPADDVWRSKLPSVPGVYIADTATCVAENSERARNWFRYFDGLLWSNAWMERTPASEKTEFKSRRTGADIMWLRLIEADAPADSIAAWRPVTKVPA